jgi:GNAT acetyltransferase-like protein
MTMPACTVVLRPISVAAATAVLAGRRPPDVRVADDYPTEFSGGIVPQVGGGSPLGPFFVHRVADDVAVGEIGGGFVAPGVAEIGYAIATSCHGRGYATDAVRLLVDVGRSLGTIERLIAHTPLERPASGRVVAKAGFRAVGEVDDDHEGVTIRVMRWELALTDDAVWETGGTEPAQGVSGGFGVHAPPNPPLVA